MPGSLAFRLAVHALLCCAPALAQVERKLHASDGAAGDAFGRGLAMDEEVLLVGSRRAAYLFSLASGAELRRYVPSGVGINESFGTSVAFDDDLVVVGSPIANVFSGDVGAVYVFDRASGVQKKRIETALDSRQEFGTSVAVNDRWLAIGDPDVPPWTGNVHLYSSTDFSLVEVISPSGLPGGGNHMLGRSLVLSGDRLVASLTIAQVGGAVMLIDLPYGPRRGLLSPAGDPYDEFGEALALRGDRVLVGAPWSPWPQQVPSQRGVVYVFDWETLALLKTVTPTSSTRGDRFGRHVAVDRNAYLASGTGSAGDAVFVFDAGASSESMVLTASDGAAGDAFAPVAAGASRRVVGAPGDDDLGVDSGSVYVYSCTPASADCDCDGLVDSSEPDCDGDGTPDDCEADLDGNGLADECQPIGPYCVELACPCGNDDGTGGARGCVNSTGAGARLRATGTASLTAGDLVLVASNLPSSTPVILFVADGVGSVLTVADGVTCTGGLGYRYPMSTSSSNGNASFGAPLASAPPGYMLPGLTRGFQLYYLDSGSPCGANANLTNGVRVVVAP